MRWHIYLSGEIHTDWRERIKQGATAAGLDIQFTAPVTDHAASDAAGTAILGEQERPPEHDHALKEVDRAALAVAREPEQVVEILRYALADAAG
jgi:hypothetical protein